MICKDFDDQQSLYLYDELTADRRKEFDGHLASCAQCRARFEEIRRFHQVLLQRRAIEVPPDLLADCRMALSNALDGEPPRGSWPRFVQGWLESLRLRPAFGMGTAFALLVFGFGLGWSLRPQAVPIQSENTRIASSSFLPDLENVRISGITRVAPDLKTGEVHITLDAERRVSLEGSLDDPHIQQLLVYAVKSYNNPGIRRDTLDVLRSRGNEPNVRQALLYAVRHDANPGVRLEALDAARNLEWGPDSKRTFLEVLEHDKNVGLRVAAINVLMKHADEEVLSSFERLAASEPNRCLRWKCAAAVRELGEDNE